MATTNNNTPLYATATLTFTREVSNLTFVAQGIDKGTLNTPNVPANGAGSDFTDELGLCALNWAGARVAPTAGSVSTVTGVNGLPAGQTVNGTVLAAVGWVFCPFRRL